MSAPNNEELEERVGAAEARLSALTARVEHCSQRCSRLACASSPALEDAVADKLERCIHMFCTSKARQRAAMPTRTFKGDLEEFLPHLGQPPQTRAGGGAWVLGSDGDCIEARPTEAPADEAVAVSADLGDDLDAFASGGDY